MSTLLYFWFTAFFIYHFALLTEGPPRTIFHCSEKNILKREVFTKELFFQKNQICGFLPTTVARKKDAYCKHVIVSVFAFVRIGVKRETCDSLISCSIPFLGQILSKKLWRTFVLETLSNFLNWLFVFSKICLVQAFQFLLLETDYLLRKYARWLQSSQL